MCFITPDLLLPHIVAVCVHLSVFSNSWYSLTPNLSVLAAAVFQLSKIEFWSLPPPLPPTTHFCPLKNLIGYSLEHTHNLIISSLSASSKSLSSFLLLHKLLFLPSLVVCSLFSTQQSSLMTQLLKTLQLKSKQWGSPLVSSTLPPPIISLPYFLFVNHTGLLGFLKRIRLAPCLSLHGLFFCLECSSLGVARGLYLEVIWQRETSSLAV